MLSFLVVLHTLVNDRVDAVHRRDDEGATAVEYGLLVALIAVAIIVVVGLLGGALNDKFQQVLDAITGA